MRIVTLIENTEGAPGCTAAHGLSFYIETESHKLLSDLGPSEETLKNAKTLGIDLTQVDTVVLSHGHYDHSGGIMPFSRICPNARIFMRAGAEGDYFAKEELLPENDDPSAIPAGKGFVYRYIGIDPAIPDLPGAVITKGSYTIDKELSLLTVDDPTHPIPSANRTLYVRTPAGFVNDDFKHEHFLVITSEGKKVLISGCAHSGMLNIMDAFIDKTGTAPDFVISGFHMKKNKPYTAAEIREISDTARRLLDYDTMYYTCHCTGLPAFDIMKEIMGDRLKYVHTGDEILI